jgi:hypothetical protein
MNSVKSECRINAWIRLTSIILAGFFLVRTWQCDTLFAVCILGSGMIFNNTVRPFVVYRARQLYRLVWLHPPRQPSCPATRLKGHILPVNFDIITIPGKMCFSVSFFVIYVEGRLYPPGVFLVLIFRGWVDPRAHGSVGSYGKDPQWHHWGSIPRLSD